MCDACGTGCTEAQALLGQPTTIDQMVGMLGGHALASAAACSMLARVDPSHLVGDGGPSSPLARVFEVPFELLERDGDVSWYVCAIGNQPALFSNLMVIELETWGAVLCSCLWRLFF